MVSQIFSVTRSARINLSVLNGAIATSTTNANSTKPVVHYQLTPHSQPIHLLPTPNDLKLLEHVLTNQGMIMIILSQINVKPSQMKTHAQVIPTVTG